MKDDPCTEQKQAAERTHGSIAIKEANLKEDEPCLQVKFDNANAEIAQLRLDLELEAEKIKQEQVKFDKANAEIAQLKLDLEQFKMEAEKTKQEMWDKCEERLEQSRLELKKAIGRAKQLEDEQCAKQEQKATEQDAAEKAG